MDEGGLLMKSFRGLAFGMVVIAAFFAACSAGGDGDGNPPPAGSGYYAYTANQGSHNVSAFKINTATGALTSVAGYTFAGDDSPESIAFDPTGKFAYIASSKYDRSGYVSAFTINASTGALTPVAGSPFAAGIGAISIVVDPSGKFAYVANDFTNDEWMADYVSAFIINASTGALTPVPGSPFATELGSHSVVVDPSGKFAYVANMNSGNISAFTINASTGALTPVPGSPFDTVDENPYSAPTSVAVDPSGKFVYVANQIAQFISAFTINASTGELMAVPGSPFAAGVGPVSVAVDPSGKFVYVADTSHATVSAFIINAATGMLTAVAGSPFAAGHSGPRAVAVDPSGKFVYVANRSTSDKPTDGCVSAFTINASTGALTAVAGSPFAAGDWPVSVAVVRIKQ
jgi:6-phosphogluconolactonase